MNKAARATISTMRRRGYRVLFMLNYDASLSVTAVSPSGQAYIVHGKLCDESRLITELARIVDVGNPTHSETDAASASVLGRSLRDTGQA